MQKPPPSNRIVIQMEWEICLPESPGSVDERKRWQWIFSPLVRADVALDRMETNTGSALRGSVLKSEIRMPSMGGRDYSSGLPKKTRRSKTLWARVFGFFYSISAPDPHINRRQHVGCMTQEVLFFWQGRIRFVVFESSIWEQRVVERGLHNKVKGKKKCL